MTESNHMEPLVSQTMPQGPVHARTTVDNMCTAKHTLSWLHVHAWVFKFTHILFMQSLSDTTRLEKLCRGLHTMYHAHTGIYTCMNDNQMWMYCCLI